MKCDIENIISMSAARKFALVGAPIALASKFDALRPKIEEVKYSKFCFRGNDSLMQFTTIVGVWVMD